MKTVCKWNQCAGCMACAEICPCGAIEIKDTVIAFNAVISENKCVGCGLCVKVCPNLAPIPVRRPVQWSHGWAVNADVRANGASGGYASAIARAFIREGGVVCSCTFENGAFKFLFAESESEVVRFAGSKYVKSDPSGIYGEICTRLKENQKILFIGLPCQVAALKSYVGSSLEKNLYTVDLICHGTPSPQILELFLKQHGKCLGEINDIQFRKKHIFQIFADEESVIQSGVCDGYMIGFLNFMVFTENCYSCRFAKQERVSDVTLGDSWGSDLLQQASDKGVSLCLCQTDKGKQLLDAAYIYRTNVDVEKAIENNQQLKQPSVKPRSRDAFFQKILEGQKFDCVVLRYLPMQSLKQMVKWILLKLGIIHR